MFLSIPSFFSWIHWDPDPVVVTLPFIDRPIAWYGLFFVIGFLGTYWILVAVFSQLLSQSSAITERNIANWGSLLRVFREKGSVLHVHANKKSLDTLSPASRKSKATLLHLVRGSRLTIAELKLIYPKIFRTPHDLAIWLVDRLGWFLIPAIIIGARLGHLYFYETSSNRFHPWNVIKVWEGGLASHGGAIGIIFALVLYYRYIRKQFPEFTFITFLDVLAIPAGFACGCIRIGNFFNQEIIGTASTVFWAVVFEHPMDGSAAVPRHPVQLYEAALYFLLFGFLWLLRKKKKVQPGVLSGLFLTIAFSCRFVLEFFKQPQHAILDHTLLQTGQYLSIPFILMGLLLLCFGKVFANSTTSSEIAFRNQCSAK